MSLFANNEIIAVPPDAVLDAVIGSIGICWRRIRIARRL
jgi:hypothetical protein